MVPSLRIVTRIPLNELWDHKGDLSAVRIRNIGHREIAELLRRGQIRFIVADCGKSLQWIPYSSAYDYWKAEVKPRIAEMEILSPADFPGNYCYVASEWADGQPSPIVLLERYH